MAVGSTIYSCTFFKKIYSDKIFHITEDSQHHLLNWLLRPVLFLYRWVSLSPLQWLSFQLRFVVANSRLDHMMMMMMNYYYYYYYYYINNNHTHTHTHFSIHDALFFKFRRVSIFQLPKTWWQIAVQFQRTPLDLVPFWMALKQMFLQDWNNFCFKPTPKMQNSN